MEAHKKKSLSRIIQCFSLFLVLHIIEELVVIPRLYVNTKGVLACIGGFFVLLFYIRYINKPLEEIGMIFSGHKLRKGILLAAVFNLVPAAIVYALEFRRYSALSGYTNISIYYDKPEHAFSAVGFSGFLTWAAIGLGIALVHSFFYEMTFRGLLVTLGSRSLHFWSINLIQSGLYTFWYLFAFARVVLFYRSMYTIRDLAFLLGAMLIYEMLTALKLGMLRSSTGAIWVCIFDHIAFMFLFDMVHIQYTSVKMLTQTDGDYYLRIIAYQVIALLITSVYYFYKKQKIREMHREREMRMEQGDI